MAFPQTTGLISRRAALAALAAAGVARPASPPGFLLGLYQLPKTRSPWRDAAEAGFNLVQLQPRTEDFRAAQEAGLYGWLGVGSIDPAKRAESEQRIRAVVEKWKNEPALLMWETEDEPAYQWNKPGPRVSDERIIETARFVRKLDPAHKLYLNHAPVNLVETMRRYDEGGDVIAMDIYPVIPPGIRPLYALWPDGRQGDLRNTYISQVGDYTRKMRAVAGRKPLLLVLQAFAWEQLREKDRDPAKILYPTRAETRFMAYQAIANGANGLIYWGLQFVPEGAPFWEDLKAVSKELRYHADALAAPAAKLPLQLHYEDTGHSLDRGIEWIAKPASGGTLLIAVNADPNPVEARFDGLAQFQRVEALPGGAVSFSGGRFRQTFAPFEARVFRLS